MSEVCGLRSVPQALADEEAPVLTAITAERTEQGVRLHLVIEGAPPVVQDMVLGDVSQILLDPEQPLWTALPLDVPVTDAWIAGVHLFPDPAAAGGTVSPTWYPVDLITIRTDQPRRHWVMSLASEIMVDLGESVPPQPWSAPTPSGEPIVEPAADPAELGVTAEALQGMLQRPAIPPLPQEPKPPVVPAPAGAATELHGLRQE